ncbi:MAG: hypothetical protein AB7T38_08560 [Nitrospirales bacterium]
MFEKQSCKFRFLLVWLSFAQAKSVWLKIFLFPGIIVYGLFCGGGFAHAVVLAKADFESDRLTEWRVFTTPNGTFGGEGFPAFAQCDAAGTGHPSQCLQVKVGQIHFSPDQNPQQGGGLEFQRELASGRLHLSARVMVTYHSSGDRRNLAGGLFEWVVDGNVVGMQDLGPIENGALRRYHLTADHVVEAGSHTVQLRISRPFKSEIAQQAPMQLVDDLTIAWSSLRQESR